MLIYKLLETGLVPEQIIRLAIRVMLKHKLSTLYNVSAEEQQIQFSNFLDRLRSSPIAIDTKIANEQHYELPTEFFKLVLGPRLKYSCALWPVNTNSLATAELQMLDIYCQRAEIANGQTILDLGCGWGSMSLYIAEKYPQSQITALSNSSTQKAYIEETASSKGFTNIEVITANIVDWETSKKYDRIISIEMLEHMKNYEMLFAKLKHWLCRDGKLFAHIFCHKNFAYDYESEDDWLAEHFFSGGTMPAKDLFLYFQKDIVLLKHWIVDGTHYQKTSEAWLDNMKNKKEQILPIVESTYGKENAKKWWIYWQVFFLACAELFGYRNGSEWLVSHYLFALQDVN
jgi:cyclopropane-fatty-acyl-phospholipid synthase